MNEDCYIRVAYCGIVLILRPFSDIFTLRRRDKERN
jgi:hypothetical protein